MKVIIATKIRREKNENCVEFSFHSISGHNAIIKKDENNAIKSAIPWKSVHFVPKMMKNTLKVMVHIKKEAKRDSKHRVLL